jgi:hypothetical protein
MLESPDCRLFIAGTNAMLATVDKALAGVAGSADAWQRKRAALVAAGHWAEVLY